MVLTVTRSTSNGNLGLLSGVLEFQNHMYRLNTTDFLSRGFCIRRSQNLGDRLVTQPFAALPNSVDAEISWRDIVADLRKLDISPVGPYHHSRTSRSNFRQSTYQKLCASWDRTVQEWLYLVVLASGHFRFLLHWGEKIHAFTKLWCKRQHWLTQILVECSPEWE